LREFVSVSNAERTIVHTVHLLGSATIKKQFLEKFLVRCTLLHFMARQPKTENAHNPLRQLRELIYTRGTGTATQSELSREIGVPLDTIKSIESGRRPLSRQIQKTVRVMFGVIWDQKKKQWGYRVFKWNPKGVKYEFCPATKADIQTYRKMLEEPPNPNHLDRDRDAVKMRIDALFEQVKAPYWMRLFESMQDSVEELREELVNKFKDRKKLDSVFAASANRSYLHDLGASELRQYRIRMAERYATQTKNVRPDGSITWSP
jgi:hypothetical protein